MAKYEIELMDVFLTNPNNGRLHAQALCQVNRPINEPKNSEEFRKRCMDVAKRAFPQYADWPVSVNVFGDDYKYMLMDPEDCIVEEPEEGKGEGDDTGTD